jgi:hypothetical protein
MNAAMKAKALAALAAPLVACSGPHSTSGDSTVTSESGALRVAAHTLGGAPQRGTNEVELTIKSAGDGGTLDGLTIAVKPWMPAMGHGTSVVPSVTAEGTGKYLVTNLDLFMPGHWELRTTISGPVSDYAAPAFDIP